MMLTDRQRDRDNRRANEREQTRGVCDASEQDSMRKKAGMASALSHACDSQRVCGIQANANERHPGDETHTETHTDDATT